MPEFVRYERYQVCNRCARVYEVAQAQFRVDSPGRFGRDKRFGEVDGYVLDGWMK